MTPEQLILALSTAEDRLLTELTTLAHSRKQLIAAQTKLAQRRAVVETSWTDAQRKLWETQRMLLALNKLTQSTHNKGEEQ